VEVDPPSNPRKNPGTLTPLIGCSNRGLCSYVSRNWANSSWNRAIPARPLALSPPPLWSHFSSRANPRILRRGLPRVRFNGPSAAKENPIIRAQNQLQGIDIQRQPDIPFAATSENMRPPCFPHPRDQSVRTAPQQNASSRIRPRVRTLRFCRRSRRTTTQANSPDGTPCFCRPLMSLSANTPHFRPRGVAQRLCTSACTIHRQSMQFRGQLVSIRRRSRQRTGRSWSRPSFVPLLVGFEEQHLGVLPPQFHHRLRLRQ